jgi:tetratricopeptide (TPR) repeat protein
MDAGGECLDEERLFALAQGSLDACARAHLDACDACRALLGHTLRSLRPGDAPAAATVGRYQIEGLIGAGAMGVVYRARDPVLGRAVAVKVLRAARFEERQLREAEALARLSHPNVVTVYDAGRVGERVFVAMELVEGETLAAWLASRPRAAEQIVARFREAGAGLAAAHATGLVHRDFKPHNVLCGDDGRVRVADFGLAHLGESAAAGAARGAGPAGTPAYMAPEQLANGVVDARSDQFGFCVALYEALYGARPFTGDTIDQLAAAVAAREVAPPRRAGVRAAVRSALARGLRRDPAERYPDMAALLAALAPRPSARRKWSAAVLLLACAVAIGWRVRDKQRRAMCDATAAELEAVWGASQGDALERAFSATGLRYATALALRTRAGANAYAADWRAARVAACVATLVRGEQPPERLERRVACLADRREELGAVAALLQRADAAVVDEGLSLIEHLTPIAECADAARLAARRPLPLPPAARAEADAIGAGLASAWVDLRLGRGEAARTGLVGLWPRVRALGYLPLEAAAHLLEGRLQADAGHAPEAIAALEQAASAAEAGRDDEAVARARVAMIEVFGTAGQDRARALGEARYASAAIERLGGSDRLEGDRQLALARAERAAGGAEAALAAFAEAERRHARAFGGRSVQLAEVLTARAGLYEALGRHVEAARDGARASEIAEAALGRDHPALIRPLTQLGILYATEGRHEEARARYTRALAIAAATIGLDDARTASLHAELGLTLARLDRGEEAEAELRTALAISERSAGPEHADTGSIHDHLGVVRLERGDAAAAIVEHRRALAIFEATLGSSHPRTGRCLHHLAADELELGQVREALAAAERARAILETAYGGEARDLAVCLTLVGEARLRLGDAPGAIVALERALTLREARHASPRSLGETRSLLGRALSAAHRDPARAEALIAQATVDLRGVPGPRAGADRDAIERWRKRARR